jgi:5-(aminomethyl)-3-furanmethanol phosphate kinase
MWVVKLGGSLNADPLLPQWLQVLAQAGAGRSVLVCGGGRFADEVRAAQAHWHFDDLAAHNMALLAMAQTAYLLRALQPALHAVDDEAQIGPALRAGRSVLWSPARLCTDNADADTTWDVTSDTLALMLAQRLQARGDTPVQGLVMVKSCEIAPHSSLDALAARGVVDARFAAQAARQPLPIQFLHRSESARLQALLGPGTEGRPGVSRTI